MRAYRFKALSLEELMTPPAAEPVTQTVESEPVPIYDRPRDGFETVKIDRIAVRRQRARRRALIVALAVAMLLAILAAL